MIDVCGGDLEMEDKEKTVLFQLRISEVERKYLKVLAAQQGESIKGMVMRLAKEEGERLRERAETREEV